MIKVKDLYPLMLEAFNNGKSFSFPVKGSSMQPMLHSSDVVTIEAKDEYHVGDIVLFKRNEDTFVLHRIIKVYDKYYDIVGDHQTSIEKEVEKKKVVGYVTSYKKKGESKIYNLSSFRYKIYKQMVKLKVVRFIFSRLK